MDNTPTMTPIAVVLKEVRRQRRQRGVYTDPSILQLRNACRARWAQERKNLHPQNSLKERFVGMEDWVDHRQVMEEEEDFQILKRGGR